MGTRVIADSTSYMGKQLLEKYNINQVSLSVDFGDESYRETEISNEDFYNLMDKKGIPKSSQPPIGELVKAFYDIVSSGDSAVGVFLSSDMSGTYQSALMAKNMVLEKLPDAEIEVVDSKSNCMQLGFAVLAAAKAAIEGLSLDKIVEKAKDNIDRSRFLFIPDNLVYLEKGGRIGRAGAMLGNLLKIIPILTVEDGITSIYKKVRTKQKAVTQMIEKILEDAKDFGGLEELVVHHINCIDEAKLVAEKLKEILPIKTIAIHDIGPVIGLHVGPGVIGIAYYTKEKMR